MSRPGRFTKRAQRGRSLYWLFVVLLAACSSLLPESARLTQWENFTSSPALYILYTPSPLQLEEKLRQLGWGQTLDVRLKDLESGSPAIDLIKHFLADLTSLPRPEIVAPEDLEELELDPRRSVLFFHSSWQLVHRRVPPAFSSQQMRVGVIAKVIPLAQVLDGKGPLSLRTAIWEASCVYEPLSGTYHSYEAWTQHDGSLLRQALAEAQRYCGERLAEDFSRAWGTSTRTVD